MREAIRTQLIAAIPEIEGRVYEPHVAGRETPKPYLVIRQGVDTDDTPWTGFRRIVEVWPYLSRTSFKNADALVKKVAAALGDQPLTTSAGEVFTCQYLGTAGPDVVDHQWDAIARGLRFAVLALQPVAVPETVASDAWVEAVSSWTGTLLGNPWTVYRNAWPLGYRRPAVMWRLAGLEVEGRGQGLFQVRKRLVGHVLGSTPNGQAAGVLQVVEGLGGAIKLVLDGASKKYMTVAPPAADLQADGLVNGQVSVTLSRLTTKPTEEAPLMQRVSASGVLQIGR